MFDRNDNQFHYPNGVVLNSVCGNSKGAKRQFEKTKGDGWEANLMANKRQVDIVHDNKDLSWEFGKRGNNTTLSQMVKLFAGLQKGKVVNEVDYSCDAAWTAMMGRMATHLGRTVTIPSR